MTMWHGRSQANLKFPSTEHGTGRGLGWWVSGREFERNSNGKADSSLRHLDANTEYTHFHSSLLVRVRHTGLPSTSMLFVTSVFYVTNTKSSRPS